MKQKRLKGYSLKEQIALFASFERAERLIECWRNNGSYEKFDEFLLAVADEKAEVQDFGKLQRSVFSAWANAIRKYIKSYREKGDERSFDVYLLEVCERHKKNNIRSKEKR